MEYKLHHWTEDSNILITVLLYVRFCHIFFSIVMFEYVAFVVSLLSFFPVPSPTTPKLSPISFFAGGMLYS